jgi:uncharacterized membrane protein
MLAQTVQLNEVIWFLAALPGLIVWLIKLQLVFRTQRAVHALGYEQQLGITSTAALWEAIGIVSIQSALALLGLFGMTQPAYTQHITPLGWAVTVILVWVSIVVTAIGLIVRRADMIDTRRIVRELRLQRGAKNDTPNL